MGFGCLDRRDLMRWIDWTLKKCGEDVQILLHGNSMGGATVLMASGLKLPGQVKGIISDCGFTSAKEVFSHVLRSMVSPAGISHDPDCGSGQPAEEPGYGLDECNAQERSQKSNGTDPSDPWIER